MAYTLKTNDDSKYIYYKHSGLIEREEIGDAWRTLLTMDEFTTKGYNLLSDFRGGEFNFGFSDLSFIEDFLKSISPVIQGKKNAVIVDKPTETGVSLLFENRMAVMIGFYVKTFSTLEAAVEYLH